MYRVNLTKILYGSVVSKAFCISLLLQLGFFIMWSGFDMKRLNVLDQLQRLRLNGPFSEIHKDKHFKLIDNPL
jgi:hypothetical protein